MALDLPGAQNRRIRIVLYLSLSACLIIALSYRLQRNRAAQALHANGAYCDRKPGTASQPPKGSASIPTGLSANSSDEDSWAPKVNQARPSEAAPHGMVWVPGGQFWMGTNDPNMPDTRPWHKVYVDGLWVD